MIAGNNIHQLNGHIHNIMSLLKFIKEDALIKNQETKEMLEIAITKESEIYKILLNLESMTKDMK